MYHIPHHHRPSRSLKHQNSDVIDGGMVASNRAWKCWRSDPINDELSPTRSGSPCWQASRDKTSGPIIGCPGSWANAERECFRQGTMGASHGRSTFRSPNGCSVNLIPVVVSGGFSRPSRSSCKAPMRTTLSGYFLPSPIEAGTLQQAAVS